MTEMSQATARVPKVSESLLCFECHHITVTLGSKWEFEQPAPSESFRKRLNPGVKAGSGSTDYCSVGENKCVSAGGMTNG